MRDERTPAEKAAAEALLKAHIKRTEDEQAARGPNPLQQPLPRYPGAPSSTVSSTRREPREH